MIHRTTDLSERAEHIADMEAEIYQIDCQSLGIYPWEFFKVWLETYHQALRELSSIITNN